MADATLQQNNAPAITVLPNGAISGIQGMLDQIAGALVRQARVELLPVLQADQNLQRTIGSAIGEKIAKPLWVIAGTVVLYAGWKVYRKSRSARS